jgi:glycosyltransferase involved in cell wall biosynthesis
LVRAERRALIACKSSFVCSDEDARYLQKRIGVRGVEVVPNSVETFVKLEPAHAPVALFVGIFGYRPNVLAAEELIHEVWPSVRRHVPGARLVLVGREPERVRGYHDLPEDIQFTGFVEDLQPYYEQARLVVCPIRYGSGTRVKIIEATAYARCVLTTSIGAEGLLFEPGREIEIEDRRDEFALRCAELLQNPGITNAMGLRAFERSKALYSRNEIVGKVRAIMTKAIASSDGGAQ